MVAAHVCLPDVPKYLTFDPSSVPMTQKILTTPTATGSPKVAGLDQNILDESITTVVLELGVNGHFSARTCGIYWSGAKT